MRTHTRASFQTVVGECTSIGEFNFGDPSTDIYCSPDSGASIAGLPNPSVAITDDASRVVGKLCCVDVDVHRVGYIRQGHSCGGHGSRDNRRRGCVFGEKFFTHSANDSGVHRDATRSDLVLPSGQAELGFGG